MNNHGLTVATRELGDINFPDGDLWEVQNGVLVIFDEHRKTLGVFAQGEWRHWTANAPVRVESTREDEDSDSSEPTVWYTDLTDIPVGVRAWSVDETDEDISWTGEGPGGDSYAERGPFTTVRPSQRNTPPPGKEPRVWFDVRDIPDGVRFTDTRGDIWDGKYDGVIYYRRSASPWSNGAANDHLPFTEVIE